MKLFLFLSAVTLTVQLNWQEFISYDGNFRVQAPGTFTEQIDTVETAVGKLAYHTFHLQKEGSGDDNLFYMISYVDYPEGIIFADSSGLVAEFFEASISSAVESVDGELRYDTDITLDGHPGKYWRIDYLDGKAVIKTKAFIVGNRYYSIQTISNQERNINMSGDHFFDSFRLLK